MPRTPRVIAKKPKSVLKQPISVDYKAFAVALAKGAGHALSGKFDDLADDGADSLAALGLEGKSPEALSFLLLQQAMQSAVAALLEDSREHLPDDIDLDTLLSGLENAITGEVITLDFFQRPTDLPLLKKISSALCDWLTAFQVAPAIAETISQRLPGFFPYALHKEWQRNGKYYEAIRHHIQSPFTQAAEREAAWLTYAAQLQQRLNEGVFSEAFSLLQIYIPLYATYEEDIPKSEVTDDSRHSKRRVVVKLQEELESWIKQHNKDDAVRAISGGPGSGKSSFAKVFAAKLATEGRLKVLFVPLHLIDPTRDFADEIGRFVRDEGLLKNNPLDAGTREPDLLIILDGLDELASQGRAAAATARDFVRTVQQSVDRRNSHELQLRVLFSGREVVIQESESEFRRPRQVLTVLPYFLGGSRDDSTHWSYGRYDYHDPQKLIKQDLRKTWWQNYGRLTGLGYGGLPKELDRKDLLEITAQPLLNYLLALSFCRKKLDFTAGVNLNQIYRDLVEAVYERGYEHGRRHASVRDLSTEDFILILEEIGLAAWHGDGRTTTVAEIEQHCRDGGFGGQLDAFQDGAKRGITRLLAAFFFRQHGTRPKGDHTFVFTHKSFGEYLAARRLVRAMQDVVEERQRRESTGRGKGWSEADALERWAKWCGPTAMSTVIHRFLIDEVALIEIDKTTQWQQHFTKLFGYLLRHGMPMEKLQLSSFQDALFQSRNAEEALLAALNACSRATHQISQIETENPAAFGAWFKRIQSQRTGPESVLAARCLTHLRLSSIDLHFGDYYDSDLSSSEFQRLKCRGITLEMANLRGANLIEASLHRANLGGANLSDANLTGANLSDANLTGANLTGANLSGADLTGANLSGADLTDANLIDADLTDAILSDARLTGSQFNGAIPIKARISSLARPQSHLRSNTKRKTSPK